MGMAHADRVLAVVDKLGEDEDPEELERLFNEEFGELEEDDYEDEELDEDEELEDLEEDEDLDEEEDDEEYRRRRRRRGRRRRRRRRRRRKAWYFQVPRLWMGVNHRGCYRIRYYRRYINAVRTCQRAIRRRPWKMCD